MTTPITTTEAPVVPVDPGIIAGTTVLGFVPLRGPAAEAAVRAAHSPSMSWGTLASLKLLLPAESRDVIISPYGSEMLMQIVEQLMDEVRGHVR